MKQQKSFYVETPHNKKCGFIDVDDACRWAEIDFMEQVNSFFNLQTTVVPVCTVFERDRNYPTGSRFVWSIKWGV